MEMPSSVVDWIAFGSLIYLCEAASSSSTSSGAEVIIVPEVKLAQLKYQIKLRSVAVVGGWLCVQPE